MKRIATIVTILILLTSCEDFVQIPPPDTGIVRVTVFDSDETALAAMTGIYIKLINSNNFAAGHRASITVLEGLYADELISYTSSSGSSLPPFYLNSVGVTSTTVSGWWASMYNIIYSCNAVVEGLEISTGVSAAAKAQLTGEALFVRAFTYFYLAQLFGDVPYTRTTDYTLNSKVTRAPIETVYEKITEDLLEAKFLLIDAYPTANRVRPNRGAAMALLARVYLYKGDWENAEAEASEVIGKSAYILEPDLDRVFLNDSREALWQLMPQSTTTYEGQLFILVAPPADVALRTDLANAFESDDLRRLHWVDSILSTSGLTKWFCASKYNEKISGTSTEYSMVLRVAEQYLIRAEARAMQEDFSGASDDVNEIRSRANLESVTLNSVQQSRDVIEQERKLELFTEWGHRFFDLKRWNRADAVLDVIKPNWDTTDILLPIPQTEIFANPRLTQNHGY